MNKAMTGAALLGGYLLGRTKKGKLAMAVAAWAMKKNVDTKKITSAVTGSPAMDVLNEQVRKDLLNAGKDVSAAAVGALADRLADSLHERTVSLQEETSASLGSAEDESGDEPRDDERDEAEEEPEHEERDEPEEEPEDEGRDESEEEPEDEGRDEPEEEPEQDAKAEKKPAAKSGTKSGTKSGAKSEAKSDEKPAAKKTSRAPARKTAARKKKAAGGPAAQRGDRGGAATQRRSEE
ncbi:hypothetical protein [Streptomyces albidochromogenes]|uniref:Histone protein n=1 Tax=Streptomyces albidochromogenes TaxID=329524 RepID=A0ABW6FV90_9ACTN